MTLSSSVLANHLHDCGSKNVAIAVVVGIEAEDDLRT